MPYIEVWVDPTDCDCDADEVEVLSERAEKALEKARELIGEIRREATSAVRKIECEEVLYLIERALDEPNHPDRPSDPTQKPVASA